MSTKIGHQRRNRQKKVSKEPTACPEGKESPSLWNFVRTHHHDVGKVLHEEVADLEHRAELIKTFRGEVRCWPFVVSHNKTRYKFNFSWKVEAFAEANGLELSKATTIFDEIRDDAEGRLRMVMQRILSNGIRVESEADKDGNPVQTYALNYGVLFEFLKRDDRG